jgi:RimJ/RimL family protein N-acetyltransferase
MIKDKPSEIITERLCLRSIKDEDFEGLYRLLTNEIVAKTYILPEFKSKEEEIRLFLRLKELSQVNSRFVYGIALNGEIIGLINDVDISGNQIELGFAFHPDHHNKGYATESLKAAIKSLFDMGYTTVKTGAFETNLPSQRVMEKAGMTKLSETESIDYRGVTHKCVMFEIKRI